MRSKPGRHLHAAQLTPGGIEHDPAQGRCVRLMVFGYPEVASSIDQKVREGRQLRREGYFTKKRLPHLSCARVLHATEAIADQCVDYRLCQFGVGTGAT